jgi:hypothetical protein
MNIEQLHITGGNTNWELFKLVPWAQAVDMVPLRSNQPLSNDHSSCKPYIQIT